MKNLLLIPMLLAGSLTIAQQPNNVFGEKEKNNVFDEGENEQEEVGPSQRGPGTNTPDGDLEDAEPVPIDKKTGWLFVIAIAIVVYHTFFRKRFLDK